MSPSGSRMQISGTSALGKFFWRRASRSRFSGSKTEGAAKCFSVTIGGFDTIPPKMPGSRIYKSASRRDAPPPKRRPQMGMLVNGIWHQEDPPRAELGTTGSDGSFVRPDSRDRVSRDGRSGFKVEAGRYILVTAPSCPWAHRTVLMRKLKRLESTIGILQSDLPKGEGWAYSRGLDDIEPIGGVFHVHQVYSAANPDYTGRATVPVLWDRQARTIVNNESSEIIRMLNREFDDFGDAVLDLYPETLRGTIDAMNAVVYENINNGVYRCGFARTQQAYEGSFYKLFMALDEVEERLGRQRYL